MNKILVRKKRDKKSSINDYKYKGHLQTIDNSALFSVFLFTKYNNNKSKRGKTVTERQQNSSMSKCVHNK